MNWSDESFLISKNRYSENSLIAELYSKDHGKSFRYYFWWNFKED